MRKFSIPYPEIDTSKCNNCGICAAVCPVDTIGVSASFAYLQAPESCIFCALCEDSCPAEAINVPFVIGWANQP